MGGSAAEASRHRSPSRFAPGPATGRVLAVAAPVLSLLLPLLLVLLVQGLSPDAQRVPTGAGRYDLAAAWLSGRPGALAGVDLRTPAPVLGRAQLGLLLALLQAGPAQSVLAAAQGAMLLLALLQTGLVWWLLRRAGAGAIGAGLAAIVVGVTPAAVHAHSAVSATAIGVCWALLAGALVVGARGRVRAVAAGVAVVLAVASAPAVAPALVAPVVLLVLRGRRAGSSTGPPPATAAAVGAAVAGVVMIAVALGLGALPTTADGRALAAVEAAQAIEPAVGGAALAAWWRVDPLLAVVAAAGIAIVVAVRRDLGRAVPLLVAVAACVWPFGADPVTPLVILLPLVAVVVAAAVDTGVRALGNPRFVWSVAGSGWLTGVGALITVALVVWLTGLGGLVRDGDRPVARVERWLSSGVPSGQTVLVGLGVWPDLSAGARARIGWYAGTGAALPSSMPWTGADYVVTDSSLPVRRAGAAAAALDRSLEVARYGHGGDALEVRAVRASATPSPTATPAASAADRAALASRRQAGRQLAANPHLELGGAGRALLLSGDVDMRVPVVLAQFMTAHRITVTGFGAADAAGVHHAVSVGEVDGARLPADAAATGALLRFLSELGGDVAPTSIDAGTEGVTATFG